MEKFVVSARKYRPITFDAVVGQGHITTTLQNAIRTNHLAQAFLFCGPRGVGKTTCARILAKTINCQNLSDDISPCNTCDSCKSFNNNASFNIHELDAASNNSVEDIRNLTDQVRFPPQSGKYKIYIIDEVHMLSQAAFNAFLKTLEEPPAYAIFILATTEKHKILPTILSRCQIFDFNRIQIKDIADHLANVAQKEHVETDYQALELIAQKADGGLRDALSMFDLNVTFSAGNRLSYEAVLENLHILDYDYYFKMVDVLYASSTSEALLILDEIISKGFDIHQFVIGLNEHFRNLMVCKDPQTVKLLQVASSIQEKYTEQSAKVSLSYLFSSLSIGSQLDLNFKTAKNQRLHVEIGLMKLSQIQQVLRLSELPNSIGDEKKNDSVKPLATPISEKQVLQVAEDAKVIQKTIINYSNTKLKSTIGIDEPLLKPRSNKSEVKIQENPTVGLNESFSATDVREAMDLFADSQDNETLKIMLKREFILEEMTLTLHLDNVVQIDTFNQIKQDLATYVRQHIRNNNLQFTAEIVDSQQERRPYTAQEKYDYLVNKNANLAQLKAILDLDLMF